MSEQKTVIGINTSVNGAVEGDEDLIVEGRVEGSIAISRTLIVEPTGIVQADVHALSVVINGVLVGNITAEASVQIADEGRMMGDIRAPRVVLADGASFTGRVDMGELNLEPSAVEAEPTPAPRYEEAANRSLSVKPVDNGRAVPVESVVEARPRPPTPTLPPHARTMPALPAVKSPTFATSATVEKKSAPMPRVRALGHLKAKRKSI